MASTASRPIATPRPITTEIATSPRRTGPWATVAAIALCAAVLAALFAPASAGAKFKVGFQDFDFLTSDDQLREDVFDSAAKVNASVVRFNLDWSAIVTGQPADPASPADPAYDFSQLDAAVLGAAQRGLEPLIMIYRAPRYAEGPDREFFAIPGTWKPDPGAVAAFARAVATRYSGSFGGLPRVRYYQAWNEPNLFPYLNPQRAGDQLVSPSLFRDIVNAFYGAVKSVNPNNLVITGGTGPYGDDSGQERIRPIDFLRALFCLRPNLTGPTCDQPTNFDVLAHQPINFFQGPTNRAADPDDATTPDLGRIRRVLRAAEKAGTAEGRRHHPIWATEIWWETNPPDTEVGLPLKRQARYIEQAFYVLWKQGADLVLNFEVHDAPFDPSKAREQVHSGVFLRDFKPKPSATAFAFPFVTDRRTKRKLLAWGMAPKKGKLKIERKAGKHWRTIDKLRARRGKVFTAKLRLEGKAKLRSTVKGEKSLVWKQGAGSNGAERDRGARRKDAAAAAAAAGGPGYLRPSGD